MTVAVNSIALLPDKKVVAASGSKKLTLISAVSGEMKPYFERNTNSECKHVLFDQKQHVISAWDDGAVIIHQSTEPHSQQATKVLTRKATVLGLSKSLHLNPFKNSLYYISDGSVVEYDLDTLSERASIALGANFDPVQMASNQTGTVFVLDKKGTVGKLDFTTKSFTKHSLADSKIVSSLRAQIHKHHSNLRDRCSCRNETGGLYH